MNWKKLLTILVILASITIVVIIAFSNNELENAWRVLFTLNRKWLLAAIGAWFCYLFFDGLSYYAFLRSQGYRTRMRSAVFYSIVGFYYANITPGSSGGQPMQIYAMNKRCIPVGVGTGAVSVRFLMNQFITVLIPTVLIMVNRDYVDTQFGSMRIFFLVGLGINFIAVPLILLTVLHKTLVLKIGCFFIRLGYRLHIVKDPEVTIDHFSHTLNTYRNSILTLCKKPFQIVVQFFISLFSMSGLFFVTYFVYRSFGLESHNWIQILTAATLLFVSASYTPLPGASGAQEGGFMLFYKGIFPDSIMGLALLVWRFITYYLFLILGMFVTLGDSILQGRRERKIQKSR